MLELGERARYDHTTEISLLSSSSGRRPARLEIQVDTIINPSEILMKATHQSACAWIAVVTSEPSSLSSFEASFSFKIHIRHGLSGVLIRPPSRIQADRGVSPWNLSAVVAEGEIDIASYIVGCKGSSRQRQTVLLLVIHQPERVLLLLGSTRQGWIILPQGWDPKAAATYMEMRRPICLPSQRKNVLKRGRGRQSGTCCFLPLILWCLLIALTEGGNPRGEAGKQDGECIRGKVNLGCLLSCWGRKSESRNGVRN